MGGDFPTLAYSCQKGVDVTLHKSPIGAVKARSKSGAWGKRGEIIPSTIVESSDACNSDLDRTSIASTAISDTSSMNSVDPLTLQTPVKKKGKTKIVLMSNSR